MKVNSLINNMANQSNTITKLKFCKVKSNIQLLSKFNLICILILNKLIILIFTFVIIFL